MTVSVLTRLGTDDGFSSRTAGSLVCDGVVVSVTAALVVDEVIATVRVPAGAKFAGAWYSTTDLDTNVSPAIVLDVGDAVDDDRFIAGATVGQSAGATTNADIVRANFGYQFTADTDVSLTVKTGPGTGATSGTIAFWVHWIS